MTSKSHTITGKTVLLRPFTLDDTSKVFRMSIEEGMKKWIPDQVYADIDETEEVLKFLMAQYHSGKGPAEVPVVYGICLRQNGELIGHVGLSPLDGEVEIGYAIEESQHKKGYASDAVSIYSQWAVKRFNLPTITGIVAAENVGSCRVLEKAGYKLLREENRQMHGEQKPAKIYHFQPQNQA